MLLILATAKYTPQVAFPSLKYRSHLVKPRVNSGLPMLAQLQILLVYLYSVLIRQSGVELLLPFFSLLLIKI